MTIAAHGPSVELTFILIATGGFVVGKLFHKLKLPDITGMILLGLLLGPSGAALFSAIAGHPVAQLIPEHTLHGLSFLSQIALGLMTFSIGTHLTRHSLHNAGKRIVNLALWHTGITYITVFVALLVIADAPLPVALILAAIAVSIAPGSVISVIQKKRARGMFTKTLLGIVAISNFTTIFMFEISREIGLSFLSEGGVLQLIPLLKSLMIPLGTTLWGIAAGWLASKTTAHLHDRGDITAVITLFLVGNIAVAQAIGVSPLLINLITGIVFSNLSYHTDTVREFFGELEGILFSLFFTLAGTHLDVSVLATAGITGLVFVVVRLIGQWSAAFFVSKANGYPAVLGKYLGFAMLPKAGLSIGLLIAITGNKAFADHPEVVSIITAVVLGAVVVNEVIGPVAVAKSLDLAEETNQAAPRLIDFLHEEFIMMPLKGKDKWEHITHLSDFFITANHVKTLSKEQLHDLIIEREQSFPTAIGEHIAVPHARIPGNHRLMGVIGICEHPVDFGALDKKPVQIIVMVATPEGKDQVHLKLLAAVARIFSDSELRQRILKAQSAAEVYTILQSSEVRDINDYLDLEV